MALVLFRVILPDGAVRVARGRVEDGPEHLLPSDVTFDRVISEGSLAEAADGTGKRLKPVPEGTRVLAPVGSQEVWAAGVTYLRSRDARVEEATDATPYDLVYEAERPELFFKSAGWRVRGPGEPITVRADSEWNVPEPELALILDRRMRAVGYTIGNDVSSRSIEGENPLYLPQAKVYDGACALGPCLVPAKAATPPFDVRMEILRDGVTEFDGSTSTDRMRRAFDDLAAWLGRALSFPVGAVLLTGTGIVPDPPFTLTPGDIVRISAGGLGILENPVQSVADGTGPAPASPAEGAAR